MECILIRWEARTRTIVRQVAKSADFVWTWPDIWRHKLMTWHDIDLKLLQYVSNWSTRGYCKFRGDPPRFTRVIREKTMGRSIRSPLQVRGLINTLCIIMYFCLLCGVARFRNALIVGRMSIQMSPPACDSAAACSWHALEAKCDIALATSDQTCSDAPFMFNSIRKSIASSSILWLSSLDVSYIIASYISSYMLVTSVIHQLWYPHCPQLFPQKIPRQQGLVPRSYMPLTGFDY